MALVMVLILIASQIRNGHTCAEDVMTVSPNQMVGMPILVTSMVMMRQTVPHATVVVLTVIVANVTIMEMIPLTEFIMANYFNILKESVYYG